MNDRELLGLAAKAAGMPPPYDANDVFTAWIPGKDPHSEYGHWWDPLNDDGDALRLSVKLQISLHSVIIRYEASTISLTLAGVFIKEDMVNRPADVAARRAIVRAAAEIARLKP